MGDEDDTCRVFVSRLPPSWTDDDLKSAFVVHFGAVVEAQVARERSTEEEEGGESAPVEYGATEASRRFAFVNFVDAKTKAAALAAATLKVRGIRIRTSVREKKQTIQTPCFSLTPTERHAITIGFEYPSLLSHSH